jgi:hypothetical protein
MMMTMMMTMMMMIGMSGGKEIKNDVRAGCTEISRRAAYFVESHLELGGLGHELRHQPDVRCAMR